MDFKTQALIAIPAAIIGGVVGIFLAYKDYGVWSLVWSSIITSTINSIQVWIYSGWSPDFIFSRVKFKKHFNYGYKLTLSDLLNRVFNNLIFDSYRKIFFRCAGRFLYPGRDYEAITCK